MFMIYPEKCYWVNGEENNICIYDDTCDDYLHSQGIMYSGVTKVKFGSMELNVIVCDSKFLELDQNTRDFFVYHEVGHVKYDHKYSKLVNIARALGFLPKMEVQADCYAAAMIGKDAAKSALKSLVGNKRLPLITRIEALKRYFKVKEVPLG